jgi:hypothetical protein
LFAFYLEQEGGSRMRNKLFIALGGFALVLCYLGSSFGQPLNEEGARGEKTPLFLGRNLAVNLAVEPPEGEEGFTVLTSTGQFKMKTDLKRPDRPMELEFEGRIFLKDMVLRTGERDLTDGKPIHATYRVTIWETSESQKAHPFFMLEGSAKMKENAQIVIARSRDLILKLTIRAED